MTETTEVETKPSPDSHINEAFTPEENGNGEKQTIGSDQVPSYGSAETNLDGPLSVPGKTVTIDNVVSERVDEERGTWENQCDFFLSALGYAVGLGNVWRFPKLAYEHGGGSFLLPYTIMLMFIGLPMYFMELVLGQYSGAGPTRLYGRLAPAMKGLGFSMLCATFYVAIYYNVIIAWAIFYVFAGFQSEVPWARCNNTYVEEVCPANVSAPEHYFYSRVLGYDRNVNDWENYGEIQWPLVGTLLAAWVIVCLCLIKGVQSSGKVVYFTALFPFFVLIVFFFRAMVLDGAIDGIAVYVTPSYEKLGNPQVWADAAAQIFFSLGPAFGGLVTLASYNKFDNNCHKDALLIAFSNCGTSVFAGFVVFAILGFMSKTSGLPIDEVVEGGPALAFVVFPDAISQMEIPQLWSFLFFVMLITLGLDSMFTLVESLTTAILDHFKELRSHKEMVVVATCALSFLFGLSLVCSSGFLMFDLIDSKGATWNILLFALLEVVLVAWMYGVDNFLENIEEMNMRMPRFMVWYWKICWSYATPAILTVLILWNFAGSKLMTYDNGIPYPDGIQALAWLLPLFSLVFLPLLCVRQVLRRKAKGKPLGVALFRPTPKWIPAKTGTSGVTA